ncbi:hypothetical protein CAPTEDRAFT_188767 [Capitella teleta]|uniref:Uncharacterized protein n=1 Tax=Capitella teleta TaxID=283909 RepID=R7V3L7_CAPTE|nr:hypothetical protein CAPTEDRAFT_188767 [Capitella teleta]|eukprot:ELU13443.1 hypothetical protein CAPTEDRAFT_188767 [Capitella teleta]
MDHSYSVGHPVTNTDHKYLAFDRFHQHNSRTEADKLRRLDLVQELRGCVNTQVAEELFSIINKSRHSLTQLKPLPHVFITRLILHLINERRNRQKLLSLQRTATSSLHEYQLSSGMDGRVSVGPIKNESKPHPGILKRRKPNTPTNSFSAKKVHFAEATRPTAKDSIVAKHGSFYLCTSDMESLNEKGWLTDADLNSMNESYEIEAAKFQHRQTDGWNCGIYVLEFLSHHLNFGMSLLPPAGRRLLKTILATQSGRE